MILGWFCHSALMILSILLKILILGMKWVCVPWWTGASLNKTRPSLQGNFSSSFQPFPTLFIYFQIWTRLTRSFVYLHVQPVPDECTHLNAKNNFNFALTGCKTFILWMSVNLYSDKLGVRENGTWITKVDYIGQDCCFLKGSATFQLLAWSFLILSQWKNCTCDRSVHETPLRREACWPK